MSHPYSGAASYIYANEYRTPTQTDFGLRPLPPTTKSSNYYHPQQPVEINLRLRPDASDFSVGVGGYARSRAGMLKPTPPPTSFSISPSSQASSLPTTRSTHTHSRSHSSNRPQYSNGTHSHDGSGGHHYHQYQNDIRTYISTPSPHPYNTTAATNSAVLNSANDPFAYRSRTQPYHDQPLPPIPISQSYPYPIPEKKPKPKLKLKSKFKLTLPNPFHFLRLAFSHKQNSPRSVWSPSLTGTPPDQFHSASRPAHPRATTYAPPPALPPLPLNYNNTSISNTPHSSSAYYYADMFDNSTFTTDSCDHPAPTTATTTTVFNDTDYVDDDPSSSGWRWSNPMSPSSRSRLSRWLSLTSTIRTRSSSGTLKSKSSISAKTKQHHKMLAKSKSKSKSKPKSKPPTNANANALPTVVEHSISNSGRSTGDGYYGGYSGGYGDGYNGNGTLPRQRMATMRMATTGATGMTAGISGSSAVPAGVEDDSVLIIDQEKAKDPHLGDTTVANTNGIENQDTTDTNNRPTNAHLDSSGQETNTTSSNDNMNSGTETTQASASASTSASANTRKRNQSLKFAAQEVGTRLPVVGAGRRAERVSMVPV